MLKVYPGGAGLLLGVGVEKRCAKWEGEEGTGESGSYKIFRMSEAQ